MLCRNRVSDFAHWKAAFDSHGQAHRDAGLRLRDLWRDLSDPNDVCFVFTVDSVEKAREFIDDPNNAEIGKAAGVLEGDYRFLSTAPVY